MIKYKPLFKSAHQYYLACILLSLIFISGISAKSDIAKDKPYHPVFRIEKAPQNSDSPRYVYNITGHSIAYYLQPNDSSDEIGVYHPGEKIEVLKEFPGWLKIRYQSADFSYVNTGYVKKISTGPLSAIKPIRWLYNISGKLVDFRIKPNDSANVILEWNDGDSLIQISETTKWVYAETVDGEIGYVPRKATGSKSRLKKLVWQRSLTNISELVIKRKGVFLASDTHREGYNENSGVEAEEDRPFTDSVLNKYISLKLITRGEYQKNKKASRIWYYQNDSLFRKKDSVLRIKFKNGYREFKDIYSGDDNYFEYEGQYPGLNKFIMFEVVFESGYYFLMDKTTGAFDTGYEFLGFPFLSRDKKYICSISNPENEDNAIFELFTMKKGIIKSVLRAEFLTWGPVYVRNSDKHELFWGTDGCIYLKIKHPYVYGEVENPEFGYLKIKIR